MMFVRSTANLRGIMTCKLLLFVSLFGGASVSSSVFAQGSESSVLLRVTAIAATHPPADRSRMLLVSERAADTALTRVVAMRLGAHVWRKTNPPVESELPPGELAVRARIVSLTDSSAIVHVDSWVRNAKSSLHGPQTFFEQRRLQLRRQGPTWVVVSQSTVFDY